MTVAAEVLTALALSLGDSAVVLRVADALLRERIASQYAAFLVDPGQAAAQAIVDVTVRPGARFIPIEPGPWVILVSYRDGRYTFRSYLEAGSLDLASGRGELVIAPEGQIENFLRGLTAWLMLQAGGLLLHGAGLIRNGRGYVFFGASGSGKTTVTRLSNGAATVLSDDLVILRPAGDGFDVCGVPFRGALLEAPRTNARAPLAGLYRLHQAEEHALETLPRALAVAELLAAAPFVVKDKELNGRLVAVCAALHQARPVQRLHFRKDDGFWTLIDAGA